MSLLRTKAIPMVLLSFISFITKSFSQSFPPGFSQVYVAGGFTQPTTMDQAPDGRFFVAQQSGALRVVKNGTLLSRPFITLSVNTDGERGLLGVAVDPDFTNNNFIYLCYSVPSGSYNRISRFTASGDTVVPGSEVTVLDLDTLIANYHGGGHLEFGPDNKLYVSAGDNGRPNKSQDLDSYLGKLLRINTDGSAPTDNPYFGLGKRERVWTYGLRNPFTFSFHPDSGTLYVNDVGEITWEEINNATTGGRNLGWPGSEGADTLTATVDPVYAYLHGTSNPNLGCAITGGTFFNPDSTNYPPAYRNRYYYIDYCGNWINSISIDTINPVWSNLATDIANYSVGIMTGNDGNLYFLSRNNEALYKVTFNGDSFPIITNQPQDLTVNYTFPASFSVTAVGADTLQYQWYKDGVLIVGATNNTYSIANTLLADSGFYYVMVYNAFDTVASDSAFLTVLENQPPEATIDAPLSGGFYFAGEVINFTGHAMDMESGNIPDSLLSWVVVFHHDLHVHPGPLAGSGINTGSFTIPNFGETATNVWYRLYLIARDPDGSIDSAYVDIFPLTSNFTINTVPPGLTVTVEGQPFTAPHTVNSVQGMFRNIAVAPVQNYNGTNLYFSHWSNGATPDQAFATPSNDTTFTAFFDSLTLAINIGPDTLVCLTATDSIDLFAGNYDWYYWNTGAITPSIVATSQIPDTISYSVTVTDSAGAIGMDTIVVVFDFCSAITPLSVRSLKVYPNPANSSIYLDQLPDNGTLTIYNQQGSLVFNALTASTRSFVQLDLGSGLYQLRWISNDQSLLLSSKLAIIK